MSANRNRVILAVWIVAWMEVLAGAAETVQSTNNASPGGGGPRLQFAEPYFDFGKVQSEQVVTHDYIFTNVGNDILVISDVNSSCGCTAVTNWDRHVEPGKTGTLHVLFNTGGMAGPVAKNLSVASNDPNQPVTVLEFTATVWKWIDAIPSQATFVFGPDFQTNETRVIRLVSHAEEPVTLSSPVCTNHSFKAELKTVQEGKVFELHITVVPPLGPGSWVAPITMKSSYSKMPLVTVNAFAMVKPALVVMPPRIILPAEPLTEASPFKVKIRNNGTNSLKLSAPSINVKGVSVQLSEVEPGKLFELAVVFPAGYKIHSNQPVEVQLKSSHFQSPIVKIPVIQLEPVAN